MDTTEELGGTYFYRGVGNLSCGELYFWILLEEAKKQFGIEDFFGMALAVLGVPNQPTRGKPIGATQGTSYLSLWSRRFLNIETKMRLATYTSGSIKRRKPSYVNNLGAFVGRWLPYVGAAIITYDITSVVWKTTSAYNKIARGDDKLWM